MPGVLDTKGLEIASNLIKQHGHFIQTHWKLNKYRISDKNHICGPRIEILRYLFVQNTPRCCIKGLPARGTDSGTLEFSIIWYIFTKNMFFTIETFMRWFNQPPLPNWCHELCDHFTFLSKNTFTIVIDSRKFDFSGTHPKSFYHDNWLISL